MAALSVPLPPSVPASARLPTVSLPVSVSVAPLATVTAAVSARRSAAASASVPALTFTVPAPALPDRLLAPVEVSAPVPRLALALALLSA